MQPAERVPPATLYATRAAPSVTADTSLAAMKRWIVAAQTHGGGWVQLVFHNVCDRCGQYAVRRTDLAALVHWLGTQRGRSTVVRTAGQVVGTRLQPAVPGPPPPARGDNLVANPSLETDANHDGVPDCWEATSFGDNDGTAALTSDAHTGMAAERIDVTRWVSGDRKVVTTQDRGQCAPPVVAGRTYAVTASYRASAPAFITSFYRTRDGQWRFWTDGPPLSASPAGRWNRVQWTTPPTPDDAEAVSVALGLKTTGSLTIDDVSMTGG
jgi:hypothetical protein